MKILYVCDLCGEIYENEYEVKHCEKAHEQPTGVCGYVFHKHQVYPDKIEVRFGNITAIYKYESGLPIIGTSTRD